ncbi:MAG: hypothetical protein A3J75_02210 [Acidobacteria bacterium RBG_16_68_9]|nr:MAG: hypothetical protein A3J75_02210 [Acidobacteria bacterium RBG_16_68_9]
MSFEPVKPHDEYMHPNTGEANFNESMYFNFYDRTQKLGGFVRIGNRPNERYAEMTIAVYQPDGTALFNYQRPEIADNATFAAGGMAFTVLEPFQHLRVSYDGPAVYLAQPLDLADPKAAFTSNPFRPVTIELDYRGLSPMYGGESSTFGHDAEMTFAKGHYEQHVRAAGSITIDGQRTVLDGLGLRDHSWGPRSWQSPKYYRWLTCEFDDDFGFMGSQIATQGGTELLSGFIFRDGENHFVHDLELHTEWKGTEQYHDRITVTLHSATAGDLHVSGTVMTMLPLRNRRHGKVTRISEGMTEWRCGDAVGYGLSEYLDQMS